MFINLNAPTTCPDAATKWYRVYLQEDKAGVKFYLSAQPCVNGEVKKPQIEIIIQKSTTAPRTTMSEEAGVMKEAPKSAEPDKPSTGEKTP